MPTDSTDIVRRQIEENSRTGTVTRVLPYHGEPENAPAAYGLTMTETSTVSTA